MKKGRGTLYSVDSMLLSGQQLDDLSDYSMSKMKAAAEKILEGDFCKSPINNKGNDACSYCEYKMACRFSEFAGKRRNIKNDTLTNNEKLLELCEKGKESREKEGIMLRGSRFVGGQND